MSVSRSRRFAGTRSVAREPNAPAKMIRKGLLCSTALIAASLAASGAMAQTAVVNPTGGGTITRIGGSNPVVENQTPIGNGLRLSSVTQSTALTVNGVTINQAALGPTLNALDIRGSTSGLNSTGVAFDGVNTLTTNVSDGAAYFQQTNANQSITFLSSGSIFTGSYGVNMQTPSGFVVFNSAGQGQSFIANGTAIAGLDATSAINNNLQLGTSTFTGFATGVNATNFYGSSLTSTGGSINATTTGIRLDATGGGSTVNSQTAITAPTGIHSTNTNGATITTSGGGTINSTNSGVGTGILVGSTAGSGSVNVTVGAAIGNTTQPFVGIDASTSGTSTGTVSVTTTAAVSGANRGILVGSNATTGNALFLGANVSGVNGVEVTSGGFTTTVQNNATIIGTTQHSILLNSANNTVNINAGSTLSSAINGIQSGFFNGNVVNNAGTIETPFVGVRTNGSTTVNNLTGGAITSTNAYGVAIDGNGSAIGDVVVNNASGATIQGSQGGVLNIGQMTVNNSGLITTVNGTGIRNDTTGGALSVNNLAGGTISGRSAIFNNNNVPFALSNALGASVTGVDNGVYTSGTGTSTQISNSGSISASSGYGVFMNNGGTLVNSATGVIAGGSNATTGYAIYTSNGTGSITNNGTITGGAAGAIQMAAFGAQTLNLGIGSVTTGAVTVQYGSLTATVAGTLNGTLTSDGGGSNFGSGNITVASTGIINGGANGIVSSRGLTLVSHGAITGSTYAINHTGSVAANVSLRAGSTTSGAIQLGSGNDTMQLYSGQGTGNGGTLAAATFGAIDMGAGANILNLRGAGDGTAANGTAGSFALGSVTGVSTLQMLDTGSWTLTGNGTGITRINAGAGGTAGVLTFNGATSLTADIYVNAAVIRAITAGGFGAGTLHMINPTAEFAATGTYANDISLEVVNGQQAIDPTTLRNTSGGTITLSGRIYETAGVGGANQYVTFDGAGTTVLTNATNSWGGITTINAGTSLLGTASTISGGSIFNNGVLNYTATGTVNQNISGSGALTASGGTLTLTGANSWTGLTTVNSGVTVSGTTGSISGGSIVNNGTLIYTNTSAGTAAQNISGSGGLQVTGTGVTLNGDITLTGQVQVNGAAASLTLGGTRSGGATTGVLVNGAGAILTVADGGAIQSGQYNGVRVTGVGATVNNLGTIQNVGTGADGAVGAGVYVQNAGAGGVTTVNNGSVTDTGAGSLIFGRNAGVRHEAGSTDTLVVNNYGHIVGELYNGIENTAGGLTVNNFNGGYIYTLLGNGVSSNSASAISVTNAGVIGQNVGGSQIVGGNGVVANGALTLINQAGGLIIGQQSGVTANSTLSGSNAGTIASNGTTAGAAGIVTAAGGSITNQVGGQITGAIGVRSTGGTLALTNFGTVTGANAGLAGVNASGAGSVITNHGTIQGGAQAILLNNGGTVHNLGTSSVLGTTNTAALTDASGIYSNGALTLTNQGAISTASTGVSHGVQVLGAATITNTGTITAASASGIAFTGGGSSIVNSGTITGGASATFGYGVQNSAASGLSTITNQSGGVIGGGTGSILLNGAGNTDINLQAGSTTNGQILSTAGGTHNVTIAGVLNGVYNAASGSGVDNLTLASTGSMTSANLGAGNDIFTYQGGTFSGLVDAGSGADDRFRSVLGAGSASVSLNNLTNFETYTQESGTLTLTGSRSGGAGWDLLGGTLTLNGSLTNTGVDGFGIQTAGVTIDGANTILNVSAGSVLWANTQNAIQGNFVENITVNNSGTIGGGTNGGAGVRLNRSAVINNNAGGLITSSANNAGAMGISNSGAGVIVNNASGATITGNYAGIDNVFGIEASAPGLVVNNSGSITSFGAGTAAIRSDSGTLGVVNNAGGRISSFAGLSITGGSATINNAGVIAGSAGFGVDVAAGSFNLTNEGLVVGTTAAIRSASNGAFTVNNSGTIGIGSVDGAGVYTFGGFGFAVDLANGGTVTNTGTIMGAGAAIVSNNGTLNVDNDGTITGLGAGIYSAGALGLTNSGTIRQTSGGGSAVTLVNGGSVLNNAGGVIAGVDLGLRLVSGATTVTNAGSITGGANDAIQAIGALTLTNTGSIVSDIYSGVRMAGGGSITNAGAITGGSFAGQGYGVQVNTSASTLITNQSGGLITGGIGSILLGGAGNTTIDLQAGSTTTGEIFSTSSGVITTTIAGVLNGAYNAATGSGIDNITLASTGSMTSASLGAGNDAFTWQGGAFSGLIDGGTGTDSFISNLSGGTGSLNLANIAAFESIIHQSGNVTLTGASASAAAAIHAGQGGPGGTLIFNGTTGLTGDIFVNGAVLRAETAGAFGTGAIHLINPTVVYGATGTYANNILLEVQSPATADPSTLRTDAGVTATLSGSITQGTGAGVDPLQPLVVDGLGRIVLTNTANLWAGTTTINAGATLQGATDTISGSNTIANGVLHLLQPTSGTFAQNVSGSGTVQVSGLNAGQTLAFSGALTNANGVQLLSGSAMNITGSVSSSTSSAVFATAAGASIANSGTITGNGAIFNSGVRLTAAGTITNLAGGAIRSNVGEGINALSSSVINAAGGSISGALRGVFLFGANASVDNSGTISGGTLAGLTLNDGGSLINRSGGLINTLGGHGVVAGLGASTITNDGSIQGATSGVLFGTGGSLTNTGTISGATGVSAAGSTQALNLVSSGTITGTGGTAITLGGQADLVNLQAGSTTNGSVLLGAGADTLTIAGTVTGAVNLGSGDDSFTLVSGGSVSGLIDGGAGTDAFVLAGSGDATFTVAQAVNFETRAMNGTGTWTLTGTDVSTAGWALNSGVLALSGGSAIHDAAGVTIAGGATLALLNDEAIGSLAGSGFVNLGASRLTLAGAGTTTYAGVISGAGGLTIGSAHGLTLSGANSYTGTTVVDGVLTLGAAGVLADSSNLLISTAGIVDLQGFDETVNNAFINGVLNGTGTLTAGQYQLTGATVNANLGAGDLIQVSGVSTLNGTSGSQLVSVAGGTLTLGAADRLSDTATVVVANGATLDLNTFNDTVGLLGLSGTLNGTGTLTAGRYELTGATVNANLGAGDLIQVSGLSTLNGTSGSQLVSIAGGSLGLGASDRLSDTATVVVASGATLDLNAFNDTVGLLALAGTLNGTGALTAAQYQLDGATVNANLGAGDLFNTSGVSTLNGTSGAGNVVVQAGTLALGASDRLSDTATVVVANGATLDLNAFNDTVNLALLNGTLAGTGTLTADQYQLTGATVNANLGAGTLFNLGGVSTLTGTAGAADVLLNAGTLRLGGSGRLADSATVSVATGATFDLNGFDERIGALFGTGDVNVGAGRLTFGGTDSGFGGRLSGAGSLVHTGGLFTLMGDHTLASIRNTGGELRFLGTTTGGIAVTGGSLTGAGTIGGALTASSGAILSPGLAGVQNGIGGFTAGGLTLNGATLAIDVLGRPGGNLSDQLRINGTATLTGGLLSPTFQGGAADFDFSTRYLFLHANNLVGTFANGAGFTAADQEGLFWRVRYDLTANGAVLEVRELTNFDPGATGTGNQRAVGQALSAGQLEASDDFAGILSLFAGLNDADRAAAFESISGEPLAGMTTSLFGANGGFLTAMRDGGLSDPDGGSGALGFVGRMTFSGGRETVADRVGAVMGSFDPSASTARGAGGWVAVYGADQTLEGKPGTADVDSRLNGFAGGYGVRNGFLSIGAAAGFTRLEGEVVARQAQYESDLSHAAGYLAFDDGVWTADVTVSVYGGDLDSRRGIQVGAFQGQAMGDTHSSGEAISASVARRFQLSQDTMIALGAIGTASSASIDDFVETGAGGLSLQASGMERDWQTLQISARGTQDYQVDGRRFRVYAGAGVMATTGDREATGDMRFSGAPTGFGAFTVDGAETPPVAGLADFGLEIGLREGLTLSAGYRGLYSERLQDNQVGIKLRANW